MNINEIIDRVDKLPSINKVGIRLINMLDNENTRLQDLSQVISSDPALTTQLLKLCNSAYFGFSREICNISDAIAKLGFKTIKSLTFLAVSHSAISRECEGYSLHHGELWTNSISCAVFSKYLAQKVDYPDIETAFVAGLLRDIGKLMLNEYVSADYKKILEKVNNENLSFSQAEESLFGFDHGYIGAKLLEKWNFPSTLIETVQYHHNFGRAVEDGCENLTLISIVHIADAFTMLTGTGLGSDGMMYYFDLATFKQLGIPENQENIENLLAEIVELKLEVKKLKGMINA